MLWAEAAGTAEPLRDRSLPDFRQKGGVAVAAAARQARYPRTVQGSLALDLEWTARQRAADFPGVRRRANVQAKARPQIPVLSLMGGLLAVFLAFQVLMGCIELTRLSAETVELRNTVSVLRTENTALSNQYKRMFDPAAVQEAAEAAGMSKPASGQIHYVDLSVGDSAVVYRQKDAGAWNSLKESISQGAGAVKEYFN